MKSVAVTCPSCGAQLDVDLKTKSAICEFCNRKVVLTEDDLATSEIVANNIELAKKAFFDGDIKNIEQHARAILGYDAHNIVANFLLSYIREFYIKVNGAPIRSFFEEADLSDSSDTEIYTVLQCVAAQTVYYIPYTVEIELFTSRIDDKAMANAFLDRFLYSAATLSKSSTWFPGGIEAMRTFYSTTLTKYRLGKAYLGLYDSLRKLEDSPLVSGYKLITRAKLFGDNYVSAVCGAVGSMNESPAKTKLLAACEAVQKKIADGIAAREKEIAEADSLVYSYDEDKFVSVAADNACTDNGWSD